MKYLLVVFLLLYSCGSKKEFARSDTVRRMRMNEQLYAELYRDTRLLEFLDVKIMQVETRDSSGNVRTEMNVDISKKIDRQDLDTTKVTVNKQEEEEKIVNVEIKEERSGVIKYWVWIIGLVIVIVISFVIGIYVVRK